MIPILKIVNCTGYSLALNVSIIYYLFSLFVGGFNRVEFFFFISFIVFVLLILCFILTKPCLHLDGRYENSIKLNWIYIVELLWARDSEK